jgi:hypothetical protein
MTADSNDELLLMIDERIRRVAREVLEECRSNPPQTASTSDEVHCIGQTLQKIMAKEFVSIKEVALLLNCSDGHVRNLVGKAQKGKATNPIPYLDLDGVTVFPRLKLLEWAEQPKRNLRAVS